MINASARIPVVPQLDVRVQCSLGWYRLQRGCAERLCVHMNRTQRSHAQTHKLARCPIAERHEAGHEQVAPPAQAQFTRPQSLALKCTHLFVFSSSERVNGQDGCMFVCVWTGRRSWVSGQVVEVAAGGYRTCQGCEAEWRVC